MWPQAPASTQDHHPETVELHLFVPAADGSHESLLVEDDGLTFAAHEGACYRTVFTVTRAGHHLSLTAVVSGDGYPEHARTAFRLVVHGARPERVQHDGLEVAADGGSYLVPNAGSDCVVEIELA
jgi:alpha-glucosidase